MAQSSNKSNSPKQVVMLCPPYKKGEIIRETPTSLVMMDEERGKEIEVAKDKVAPLVTYMERWQKRRREEQDWLDYVYGEGQYAHLISAT